MNPVKVTVGMPAFNRAHVLQATIQQVLDQSFKDFELIIYNDGSTDNTVEIIRSFTDPRIRLLDHENMGPPHPLNGLLKEARGEYIIILHDHDFFHPQLLEKSLAALEANPSAGFVLQGSAWIDEDGVSHYQEMLHDLPVLNEGRVLGEQLLRNPKNFNSIFHACCMVRRTVHEQAGWYYETQFGLYADTDLWLRLLRITDFVYIKEVLFKFRTRETQGHFLSNREYEILDWNYQIHVANIERYFTDEAVKKALLALAHQKWANTQQQIALKYAANKNKLLFKKGLDRCNKENEGSNAIQGLFKLLAGSEVLQSFFVTCFSFVNRLRKRIQ
jgi:glycosyltransferase involved in cell wall biosynthesis